MKKLIVAVSGGVDSVVLLDMLTKKHASEELIVAHFDHGIRGEESQADARFVAALSKKYGVRFELGEGHLTEKASEEVARIARYSFLRQLASREGGVVVTAHHRDDFLETVALNLTRGTGWRGLAVMSASDIVRPLKMHTKKQLYEYATLNRLEFSEDSTNREERYLRNLLRARLGGMPEQAKTALDDLMQQQHFLASQIDKETTRLEAIQTDRHFLTMIDEASSMELLSAFFRRTQGLSLMRPTAKRLLTAVKTARAGSQVDVTDGIWLEMKKRDYVVHQRGEVL